MFSHIPQNPPLRHAARFVLGCFVLIAIALAGTGCRHQPKIDIPQMDKVDEQFVYAMQQLKEYQRTPAKAPNHKERADVTIASFQKVIDAFPDERLQVGRARLGIAMIRNQEGDYHRALDILNDLIENHTDDEVVQVNGMFEAAGILDRLGRFDEAKTYYRKIADGYAASQDPSFAEMAYRSRMLYNKVRRTP